MDQTVSTSLLLPGQGPESSTKMGYCGITQKRTDMLEGMDYKEWLMKCGGIRKDPRGAETSTNEPDT